jgi:hypothetical protein
MTRITRILGLALAVFFMAPAAVGLAADAAMVVDAPAGQAYYEGGDLDGQPVMIMDFISAGQRLRLERDAELVLNYFDSETREAVSGPGRLTVESTGGRPAGDDLTIHREQAVELPQKMGVGQTDSQKAGTVVMRSIQPGAARESGPGLLTRRKKDYQALMAQPNTFKPLSLYQTAVDTVHPVFRWEPYPGADSYQIIVSDPAGVDLVTTLVVDNFYQYQGPPLMAGQEYAWKVYAARDQIKVGKTQGRFTILDADSIQRLREKIEAIKQRSGGHPTEVRLMAALLYQGYGLYDAAADTLKPLVEQYPQNDNLASRLTLLDPSRD